MPVGHSKANIAKELLQSGHSDGKLPLTTHLLLLLLLLLMRG